VEKEEEVMSQSRRTFLTGAAAVLGSVPLALPALTAAEDDVPPQEIVKLFSNLPGEVAVKIFAPAVQGKPGLLVEFNSSKRMFVGSAIKTFVLAEALRQADSPDVVQTISEKQLALDASVWSVDSATFNPPNLIGMVSERTALEAMILHSDNTGTDMSFKLAGPDNVRQFIASVGLTNTLVPDSTRVFFGYLVGAKDYKTFTWEELVAASNDPLVNPPLNTVETMASSADDFISYYSRALHGKFFQNKETLNEFRRILAICGTIYLVPIPLGVSAYVKGGSIDVPGFHAVCVPGGMFFDDHWVYFCFTINWDAPGETDPKTVNAFLAAVNRALTVVKNALSA
jgi:beta-lactamase class A